MKQALTNRSAPAAIGRTFTNSAPRMSSSTKGLRIRHTELFDSIEPVTGVAPEYNTTNILAWSIQPGYQELFPWLSGIARKFEKYIIHSLSLHYVPRVGTNTTGNLVMSVDLDPHDELPPLNQTGKQILLAHLGAICGPVWEPLSMRFPYPSRELFTWTGSESPNSPELRTSDAGVLFVGVFDMANGFGAMAGDLLVSYDVELLMPQLARPPITLFPSMAKGFFDSPPGTFLDTPFSVSTAQTMTSGDTPSFAWDHLTISQPPPGTLTGPRALLRYLGTRPETFSLIGTLCGDTTLDLATLIGLLFPRITEWIPAPGATAYKSNSTSATYPTYAVTPDNRESSKTFSLEIFGTLAATPGRLYEVWLPNLIGIPGASLTWTSIASLLLLPTATKGLLTVGQRPTSIHEASDTSPAKAKRVSVSQW